MAASEITGARAGGRFDAEIASPAAWLRAFLAVAAGKLGQWSAAEAGRLALWAPVAIGAGAGFYFGLKSEPPLWLGVLPLLSAAGAWAVAPRKMRKWAAAGLFMGLGFLAADLRAAQVAAPMLARELTPREITGRLVSVEESAKTRRLIVEVASIARFDEALPERVRLTWRGKGFEVLPGETISLIAGLSPPPPPAAPGGFDFARQLYFQRIGAVGYAVSAPVKLETGADTFSTRAATLVERARLALARRILDKAPGEGGAIVAAVVTGKREAVSERSEAALRDSGLAHLLAISGLHMGLATGLIFFAVRFGLALIEPIALRFPIKKWAAGAALLSGFLYLLLSGGGWSAQRAFIMSSIVFIAILADRRALSLRNVAVAATIVLLMTPEAVMHPGFQMSFAAVTALIAAYEWASGRADPDRGFSALARLRRYLVGIGVTDTIAATATSPYSLFHFHRVAVYGLAANVTSVPIMGLWVMPAAIAALALWPLGLDGPVWRLSAHGVDAILAIGGAVAARKGAVATAAFWPVSALVVLTFGGLWLCLQKAAWRLAGLAAIPLAALLIAAERPPDIFVSDEGDNAAIVARDAKGNPALALFNPRKDRFAAGVWKEYAGLDKARAETLALKDIGVCDAAGCVALVEGAAIAVSTDPLGLADDCARAGLVIALYPVSDASRKNCRARLIDRAAVWDNGAHAVWIGEGGEIRVRSAAQMRGKRPWAGE